MNEFIIEQPWIWERWELRMVVFFSLWRSHRNVEPLRCWTGPTVKSGQLHEFRGKCSNEKSAVGCCDSTGPKILPESSAGSSSSPGPAPLGSEPTGSFSPPLGPGPAAAGHGWQAEQLPQNHALSRATVSVCQQSDFKTLKSPWHGWNPTQAR